MDAFFLSSSTLPTPAIIRCRRLKVCDHVVPTPAHEPDFPNFETWCDESFRLPDQATVKPNPAEEREHAKSLGVISDDAASEDTMNNVVNLLSEIREDLTRAIATIGPTDPGVQRLLQQIDDLRYTIDEANLKVVLFGAQASGKSTFLDAVLDSTPICKTTCVDGSACTKVATSYAALQEPSNNIQYEARVALNTASDMAQLLQSYNNAAHFRLHSTAQSEHMTTDTAQPWAKDVKSLIKRLSEAYPDEDFAVYCPTSIRDFERDGDKLSPFALRCMKHYKSIIDNVGLLFASDMALNTNTIILPCTNNEEMRQELQDFESGRCSHVWRGMPRSCMHE